MNETKSKLLYAQRQLRYWQNQVNDLLKASNAGASDAQEKEAEKRELPPTPPIERKGEEKERSNLILSACARARNPDDALTKEDLRVLNASLFPEHRELCKQYACSIPTLKRVIAHAKLRGFDDEAFIREWYTSMEMCSWLDKHGNPYENWSYLLLKWIMNRRFFDKLLDPKRIPDATYGGCGGRSNSKPINWRGTRKEDLDDFLG